MSGAASGKLRRDLRLRILTVALVPLLVAISMLAIYFANREIDSNWHVLESRGAEVASRLADTASFDLFAGNDEYLQRLIDRECATQHCIAIAISDRTRSWRMTSGDKEGLPAPRDVHRIESWRDKGRMYFLAPMNLQGQPDNDPYIDNNLQPKRLNVGEVLVALSIDPIVQARRQAIFATLGFAGVLILGAGLMAWRLSLSLSLPLRSVIRVVRGVAAGDTSLQVSEISQGELGELEQGVNHMVRVIGSHTSEMAQRVEEATSELREQKQAAEAAVLARSRFLAAASHDLRQPMHALILLVEALKEKLRTAPGSECLQLSEHIEASAHSMQSLLNALLDISRLDAGTIVARPECFAVGEVFDRMAQQFESMAKEKGIALHVHRTRLTLFSDPVLLERILSNLLTNAIRYTTRGRVILGVRRVQKDWAKIEVWDTGKGIPNAFVERIFEEYFQLENPERDRDKGLGLGLSIVRRLARLLGSPVDVHSRLGKGSCFSIRLVRCDPPAAREQSEDIRFDDMTTSGRPAPLVAFIDDDEVILEAMMAMFEQWNIELAVGCEVQEVLDDLAELGRKPDVILCDYRLRENRTGIEAIAQMRAAYGPDIPAILITGDTAASTIQAIAQSGLPVLHKPIKPATLRSYLSHLLSGRRAG